MFLPLTVRGLLMACLGALALFDSIAVTVAVLGFQTEQDLDDGCRRTANKRNANILVLYQAAQNQPRNATAQQVYLRATCTFRPWYVAYSDCLTEYDLLNWGWAGEARAKRCVACRDTKQSGVTDRKEIVPLGCGMAATQVGVL